MLKTPNKPRFRELTDEELVSHLRIDSKSSPQTKEKAINELIKRYLHKIRLIILQMVRNEDDAWDLTQTSFLRAHKAIPFFRGTCKFYSWLYRISVNTAKDFLRARKRRSKVEGPSLDDEDRILEIIKYCASNTDNPHQALVSLETQKLLQEAVDELSADQREVIVLRYYMQMDYKEMAELLNIQEGTLRSRVHYAREKLKDILQSPKKEGFLKKIKRTIFGKKAN